MLNSNLPHWKFNPLFIYLFLQPHWINSNLLIQWFFKIVKTNSLHKSPGETASIPLTVSHMVCFWLPLIILALFCDHLFLRQYYSLASAQRGTTSLCCYIENYSLVLHGYICSTCSISKYRRMYPTFRCFCHRKS